MVNLIETWLLSPTQNTHNRFHPHPLLRHVDFASDQNALLYSAAKFLSAPTNYSNTRGIFKYITDEVDVSFNFIRRDQKRSSAKVLPPRKFQHVAAVSDKIRYELRPHLLIRIHASRYYRCVSSGSTIFLRLSILL